MNDHETQRIAPETHHVVFLFLYICYTLDKVQKKKSVLKKSFCFSSGDDSPWIRT